MGILSKVGGYVGRGAAALATGGASEAYRAATGKADPYTAYQERLGTSLGAKADAATGQGGSMPPNPYDSETPEERKQRAMAEGDASVTRYYRDQLAQPSAPRTAVQVGAPAPIHSAQVAGAAPISSGQPIDFERVNSNFDPSQQNETRALQQGYLGRVQTAMEGNAPSAGEIALLRGGRQAAALAGSLSAGHKGAGTAALRAGMKAGVTTSQQSAAGAAQMRADEIARARAEYGNAVTNIRGQDIGVAQTSADLALRAGMANQSTGAQTAIASKGFEMDAARANQAAQLQQNLTQAGLDQSAIMHMSDQQLQVALANAGFKLSQEQIDDLREHNRQQSMLSANAQVLSADADASARQQRIKELRTQYAMAVQANDQKQQDAALSMLADLGAAYATGGTSAAAGGAIQYGANGAPILS